MHQELILFPSRLVYSNTGLNGVTSPAEKIRVVQASWLGGFQAIDDDAKEAMATERLRTSSSITMRYTYLPTRGIAAQFVSRLLLGTMILAHPFLDSITASAAMSVTNGITTPVRIEVQTLLSKVSPSQAKNAWLSYQWEQGGGLPLIVDTSSDGDSSTRCLLPIGMQEELITDNEEKSTENSIKYRVTDLGWLFQQDLVPDSHSATVEFVPQSRGGQSNTNMVWTVEFQAKNRADFYKQLTRFNIETVSANLASYFAVPQLYRRTTLLSPTSPTATNLSEEWVDFVWRQGGGLPLPPPVKLDDNRRMIVPPFLVERLKSVEENEIQYTVDNTGLFTYQVHSHVGRVSFQTVPGSNDIEMEWEVEIRPFRGWSWFVQSFTAAIVTTLARNFKCHVIEPNAMVKVASPRGKGESFAEIPKDAWLGGVLDAHLSDKRSTVEQTVAIVKPWTWGRSTDEDGEFAEWTTGYMD